MKRLVAVLAISFICTAAIAEDSPAKVDFTKTIVIDGKTIIDDIVCPLDQTGKRACETPLTLGRAAYYALRQAEQGINWDEATRRDNLANAIRDAKEWPLLNSDRDLIKKTFPRIWPPFIVGAAAKIIDQK